MVRLRAAAPFRRGVKAMSYCPLKQPVHVRAYVRLRLGRWEFVTSHCRRLPRR
jgi:hypothetical protein